MRVLKKQLNQSIEHFEFELTKAQCLQQIERNDFREIWTQEAICL